MSLKHNAVTLLATSSISSYFCNPFMASVDQPSHVQHLRKLNSKVIEFTTIQTKCKAGQRTKTISIIQWRWQSGKFGSILTLSVYLHSSYWETWGRQYKDGQLISLDLPSPCTLPRVLMKGGWTQMTFFMKTILQPNHMKGFRKGIIKYTCFIHLTIYIIKISILFLTKRNPCHLLKKKFLFILRRKLSQWRHRNLFLIANVGSSSCWLW